MKICIYGAGAIGGYLGVQLARAGVDVSLVARGAHLAAMKSDGLKLLIGDEERVVHPRCTDKPAELGVQDYVIICLKAHSITGVLDQMQPLLGPNTRIVTAVNGIPYWYFHKHGGALEGSLVKSVDPRGLVTEKISPSRVLGCVVYPASELVAPGVIKHIEGDRFPVGELDGSSSERVNRISACFTSAGFKAPVLDNIRAEIWLKLWGNLTFNPISSLSHATLVDICQFPLTRDLAAQMMTEAQAVAHKLGIEFRVTLDKRIAGAEKVGKHKTSMLQDIEAGRAPEIDALVGSVVELARLTDTPTPHIDTVYALVKLLGKTMDEERGKVKMCPCA
jgi:2-dehydropantoate 2-reductase